MSGKAWSGHPDYPLRYEWPDEPPTSLNTAALEFVPEAYADAPRVSWWWRWKEKWERRKHAHDWKEEYYDLRADEPGGPKTWHGIRWRCQCGAVMDGGSQS